MVNPIEGIVTAALTLTRDARIRLALKLLDSIEERPLTDLGNFDQAWIEEANRRYDAYLRGEDEAIPSEEVFAELRAED